jgi:c(7)-type cytochrome triheme protein
MKRHIVVALTACLALPSVSLAQKVGGGDVQFTPKNASPVTFSHQTHVKEKGVKCSGCHYQIFQMNKETASYKMDMSKLTKGEFCGKCHNGQKSFDVSSPANCVKCHK